MKANNIIETHGSITKKESLNPIEYKLLENTVAAEAGNPYEGYYGEVPPSLPPNSLFLFTKQFYPLDEIIKITCGIEEFFGNTKKLDIATSILDFTDHYRYAIRVRDFPDYEHIHWLQTCYNSEGINFIRRADILDSAMVTVFKRFKLEEIAKGIYLDRLNSRKGYVIIPFPLNSNELSEILINLRNNNDCELFDAAIGTIEIDSKLSNMVRIYSENLNTGMLKCIKQKFSKLLMTKELLEG